MRAAILSSSVCVVTACSLGALDGYATPVATEEGRTDAGVMVTDTDAASRDASVETSPPSPLADPYGDEVRKDAPVAWYRFEEPAIANEAVDVVGAKNAVASGKVGFGVEGISGRAVQFGGTTTLDVGDVFDFAGRVPFSLELWVKASAIGRDQVLIDKRTQVGADLLGYIVYLGADATPHFEGWGVEMTAWNETPIPTTFTHLVITVSYATGKGNATIWINGQKGTKGGYDNTANLANTDARLLFGDGCKGTLDEVAIYDRELSPARILAHYTAGTR